MHNQPETQEQRKKCGKASGQGTDQIPLKLMNSQRSLFRRKEAVLSVPFFPEKVFTPIDAYFLLILHAGKDFFKIFFPSLRLLQTVHGSILVACLKNFGDDVGQDGEQT